MNTLYKILKVIGGIVCLLIFCYSLVSLVEFVVGDAETTQTKQKIESQDAQNLQVIGPERLKSITTFLIITDTTTGDRYLMAENYYGITICPMTTQNLNKFGADDVSPLTYD